VVVRPLQTGQEGGSITPLLFLLFFCFSIFF
jgi:hypothetical protein